jgi:hypothetical protein
VFERRGLRRIFQVRNGKLTSDKVNFVMRNLIIPSSQGTLFVGESPKENNTGGKCLNGRIILGSIFFKEMTLY